MKHFRYIFTVTCVILALLFGGNIYFMVDLYGSVKQRCIDEVEMSLERAVLIDLVDRMVADGAGDEQDALWVTFGLQASPVDDAETASELTDKGYNQGFRNYDKQLIHGLLSTVKAMGDVDIKPADPGHLEQLFRRDLRYLGYEPRDVTVVPPDGASEVDGSLWEIVYQLDDKVVYIAYVSPLTANILHEMSGLLVTSLLILIVLTGGFGYLLRVIHRQRTIEEMKDDFTNNMTHELKTPIAIAYAATDSLLQFPDPDNTERTRRYLTATLEQLSRLTSLVESILSMSMERRRGLILDRQTVELKPFLDSIVELARLKSDKKVEFTVSAQGEVSADREHLTNVVNNLIDNSIKYSGDAVKIDITATADGIEVRDDGHGIAARNLPHIWDKFYRVSHGNRQDIRGYGIGLFYVRSIVEKHGWNITAKSRLGHGTTITIKFS